MKNISAYAYINAITRSGNYSTQILSLALPVILQLFVLITMGLSLVLKIKFYG